MHAKEQEQTRHFQGCKKFGLRQTTPYFKFMQQKKEDLKKKNPNMKLVEISKLCAQEWKNMSQQEKNNYGDTSQVQENSQLKNQDFLNAKGLNSQKQATIPLEFININDFFLNQEQNQQAQRKTPIKNSQDVYYDSSSHLQDSSQQKLNNQFQSPQSQAYNPFNIGFQSSNIQDIKEFDLTLEKKSSVVVETEFLKQAPCQTQDTFGFKQYFQKNQHEQQESASDSLQSSENPSNLLNQIKEIHSQFTNTNKEILKRLEVLESQINNQVSESSLEQLSQQIQKLESIIYAHSSLQYQTLTSKCRLTDLYCCICRKQSSSMKQVKCGHQMCTNCSFSYQAKSCGICLKEL